jgi:hypothetical protein
MGLPRNMYAMVHMIISSGNTIKIKPFTGKAKDYPKWELKQRTEFVMAGMGHVLDKQIAEKLPSSETLELGPKNPDYQEWIK